MRLSQALLRAVQQRPQAWATICDGRRRTYAQLQERVARLASALRGIGLCEGNTVALLGAQSDDQFVCHLAVAWAGAVACPLDADLALPELLAYLAASESVAACLDERYATHTDALLDACPYLRILIFCGRGAVPAGWLDMEALIQRHEPMPPPDGDDAAPCTLFPAAGARSAAALSHRSLCSAAMALRAEGPFREGCVVLQGFALSDPLGMVTGVCTLLAGGTQILAVASATGPEMLPAGHQDITDWLLPPAMLTALAQDGNPGALASPSLKHLVSRMNPDAPEATPPSLPALPGCTAYLLYGPPEAAGFATLLELPLDRPALLTPHVLGRSGSHVQLAIVDADGQELPAGAFGELRLSGDGVMPGYFRPPEAGAGVLRDGWLHTGEFGCLDDRGRLHHCGGAALSGTPAAGLAAVQPAGAPLPAIVVPAATPFVKQQPRL